MGPCNKIMKNMILNWIVTNILSMVLGTELQSPLGTFNTDVTILRTLENSPVISPNLNGTHADQHSAKEFKQTPVRIQNLFLCISFFPTFLLQTSALFRALISSLPSQLEDSSFCYHAQSLSHSQDIDDVKQKSRVNVRFSYKCLPVQLPVQLLKKVPQN